MNETQEMPFRVSLIQSIVLLALANRDRKIMLLEESL